MADTSQDTALSAQEKAALKMLAKALWRADTKDQSFADAAAKREAFTQARKPYMAKARQVAKYLGKQGLTLAKLPEA